MNSKIIFRLIVLLIIISLLFVVDHYGIARFLTFDYLKGESQRFLDFYAAHPGKTVAGFMVAYILVAALSIPGATILTLTAGALFGLGFGTVLVSFASALGALSAFFICRFLLRDFVEKKFSSALSKINSGITKEGNSYLFALRLVPVFPFFMVNAVVSLTRMNPFSFYWVSQLGMLPATILYVNVGRELVSLKSLSDIFSWQVAVSFSLLGIFPMAAKRILSRIRSARVYRSYYKPSSFDYNLVVIGAGSGGLSAAYIAAAVKAKVALVEKSLMGGDCLNTGCVPSKALIRSAKAAQEMRKSGELGFDRVSYQVNFSKVMARVQQVVKQIAPHDSVERYTGLGVECLADEAEIKTPWEVWLKNQKRSITAKNIVIAAGAAPLVPPFPGLDKVRYLTSDNLWQLKQLPKNLLVLGGGPIGCEMAQSFQRLGSSVILLEMGRLLMMEDPPVSKFISAKLQSEGVKVLEKHTAKEFIKLKNKTYLIAEYEGKEKKIQFDEVIIALGRRARVEGYGLENLGVSLRSNRTIEADEFLSTNYPNIFVCGDVAGPYQLTHAAGHQAWYAAVNALFGGIKKFKVNYSVLPWSTFTDPEVATVGLNETTAQKNNIDYEVTEYSIDDLDRAIADRSAEGFVRVITAKGKDKILGATVVGSHADLLLLEFVSAMKHGLGLNKILSTIHIYPSLGEANKYAAGNWRKAHINPSLLRFIERYHSWQRKR